MDTPFHTSNLLLRSLSDTDLATLVPNLQRGEMERELVLGEIDVPVERIHFPEGGVVSCVATENGSSTEVGLIGLEGMVGISVLFGDPNSGFRSFVQVDHDTSLSIAVADFNEAVAASATMRTAFLRYAHTFIIQISFGLVACAQHLMEARLARWLLMCHDRTDGDTILLTHRIHGNDDLRPAQRRHDDAPQSGGLRHDPLDAGPGSDPRPAQARGSRR